MPPDSRPRNGKNMRSAPGLLRAQAGAALLRRVRSAAPRLPAALTRHRSETSKAQNTDCKLRYGSINARNRAY
jgi:hypothetical protein